MSKYYLVDKSDTRRLNIINEDENLEDFIQWCVENEVDLADVDTVVVVEK